MSMSWPARDTSSMPQAFERILVVNVNWLGDAVFASPVFKALREQFPQAQISCLAVPRIKEVLECVPGISEILLYDEKNADRWLWAKLRLIFKLQHKRFDAVFLLHGSWTRAWLMRCAGIPVRVGYASKGRAGLLTHPIALPSQDVHKSDHYLGVLEGFGLKVSDRRVALTVSPQARQEVFAILQQEGLGPQEPYIVVHTSGNWDLKRWPQEHWAQLIQRVQTERRIRVVISEGPQDREWARQIARLSTVDPVVLAGKTNVHQLAALLEKALLVISADSGPLHIASAVAKKIIGIYGPTTPMTTGPRGQAEAKIFHADVGCNRASCYFLACPDNVCMKAVDVTQVLRAAYDLLDSKGRP